MNDLTNAPDLTVKNWEKALIRESITRHRTMKEAAKALGMSNATLFRKIKEYNIVYTRKLRLAAH